MWQSRLKSSGVCISILDGWQRISILGVLVIATCAMVCFPTCAIGQDSLTPDEVIVFRCWVDQQTLAATALRLGCGEAKVSYLRKQIRNRLEGM